MIIAQLFANNCFSQCTQLDKFVHVLATAVGKPFRKVSWPRGSRPCLWACCCWQGHKKDACDPFSVLDLRSVTQVYSHSAVNELIDVLCQSLWPTAATEKGNHRESSWHQKATTKKKAHKKRASSKAATFLHRSLLSAVSFSLFHSHSPSATQSPTVSVSVCPSVCLRHINYSFTLTFYYFLRLPRWLFIFARARSKNRKLIAEQSDY